MPHIINSSNCIYIRNIHRNHKWYSLFCCLPVCFQRIIHRLGERALLHPPAAVTGIGRFEPMHADFFLILSTATVTEGFTLLAERYKGMPAVRSSQLKNLAIIFLLPRRPSPTIAQKTGEALPSVFVPPVSLDSVIQFLSVFPLPTGVSFYI